MSSDVCDSLVPFWNQKDLISPPVTSVKILSETPKKISSKLSRTLLELCEVLENQSLLLRDHVGIFKRLIYRMKNVFRNYKGFKAMQMMNRALDNYDAHSTINNFTTVRTCTYDDKGPTKQMMQWTLINLQRLVALFYRINNQGMKAVEFLQQRFHSGHHWNVAAVCVAVISKIWSITKYVIIQACNWNKRLHYFLQFLPAVGNEWLPEECQLETNLMKWLGNPPSLKQKITSAPKTEDKIAVDDTEEVEAPPVIEDNCLFYNEDIGEPLDDHHIFRCADDFLAFLKSEKQARAVDRMRAKTKNLTNKQWNQLCKDVMKVVSQLKQNLDGPTEQDLLTQANKRLLDKISTA